MLNPETIESYRRMTPDQRLARVRPAEKRIPNSTSLTPMLFAAAEFAPDGWAAAPTRSPQLTSWARCRGGRRDPRGVVHTDLRVHENSSMTMVPC